MPQILTEALLADLVAKGRGESIAAWLCSPDPHVRTEVLRSGVERWVADLDPPGPSRDRLRSGDDSEFWAGWWELAYGRAFQRLGFQVNMRAVVSGKTPDLVVTGHGFTAMVEVFSLGATHADATEAVILAEVQRLLQARIDFPGPGMLSIAARTQVTERPTAARVDEWAEALNRWLAEGAPEHSYLREEPFGCRIYWLSHSGSNTHVSVTPAGKWVSDGRRPGQRIAEKVEAYAPLVSDELRLVVAIGVSDWTITLDAVETAVFGEMVLTWTTDPSDATLQRSGAGVWVPGSAHQHPGADMLAGVMVARSGFNEHDSCAYIEPAFIHNPYSKHPVPADMFTPYREMQPQGDHMLWVRNTMPPALVLD